MSTKSRSTRDRILDGAAEVMRDRGLVHTTTKQIARAAGFSEATLYKVFADKTDLFLCVLTERLPTIDLVRGELPGEESVRDTLRRAGAQALAFYAQSFPMNASLFADVDLLARHRDAVHARGAGPAVVNEAVADYLRAEQRAGRIAATADPDAVAAALIGGCFQRAFLHAFAGEEPVDETEFVRALVDTLLPALR